MRVIERVHKDNSDYVMVGRKYIYFDLPNAYPFVIANNGSKFDMPNIFNSKIWKIIS